ncbi:MAG TPA: IPT/TIG domain-containing protein, partial [Planctomycetota bacterium]|nr:IPT/TIG domain-containing protein [Planctomycetota bacterium]
PHIDKVDPPDPLPGDVVTVTGANFPEEPEGVTARVGEEPASVLETHAGEMKLLVPIGLKQGSYELAVRVGADASNAVKLAVQPESEREKRKERTAQRFGERQGLPAAMLALDAPAALLDRGSLVVRVSGAAKVPDESRIDLALRLGKNVITTADAVVQGGRFEASFGPYAKELFSGSYWVDATFDAQLQSKTLRRLFKATFKEEADREAHRHATDRQPVRIGSPEQEAAETREVRRYVARAVVEARTRLADLEQAYSSAGRAAYRKGGKVDEAAWEAWLALRSLRNVPLAERPARAEAIRKHPRFLAPDGTFAVAAWREWMDRSFRPELVELERANTIFGERYLQMKPPYHDALLWIDNIFATTRALSELRSQDLYRLNGFLEAAPEDAGVKDSNLLQIGATSASTAAIEATIAKVVRETSLTPAEIADAAAELEGRNHAEEENR